MVDPIKEDFSAFVFKIQANMNKAHRDRIAFMRICSGEFDAGMEVYHVQGNRKQRLSQPQQMMAQERHIVDKAYAGDIIRCVDPGIFSIGDTICMPAKICLRGHSDVCTGAFCESASGRYDEEKTVRQRDHADRTGRSDPDLPGVQYRYGRDHRRRCRRAAV